MKGHSEVAVGEARKVRGRTEVEEHGWLVEDQVPGIDRPDRPDHTRVEGTQLILGGGSEPRLVEEVIAEYPSVVGKSPGDVPPCRRVALLQADAARTRTIGPETLKGGIECSALGVPEWEDVGSHRQSSGVHGPGREPLSAEGGAHLVLMEIEQRIDASSRELPDGAGDRVHIGARDDAGLGLELRIDDAEANDIEAVDRQRARGHGTEAGRVWFIRRSFVDHVEAMDDDHLAVAVGEPAAGVPDEDRRPSRLRSSGGRRRRRRRTSGKQGGSGRHEHHGHHLGSERPSAHGTAANRCHSPGPAHALESPPDRDS